MNNFSRLIIVFIFQFLNTSIYIFFHLE